MTERTWGRFGFPATDHQLEYGAAVLAYLVALIHLFHPTHGFGRLVLLLSVNPALLLSDPRPVAFVLSGLALVLGVPLLFLGNRKRPLYAAGLALVAAYLVGYFAWHLSGHGGFLPGREPLYHGMTPVQAVASHLGTDPWAAAAVVTELALAGVLLILVDRGR